MRKILASVLALSMVASVGVTAFAATNETTLNYTAFTGKFVDGDGKDVSDGDTYRTGVDIYGIIGNYNTYSYLFDKDVTKISIDKDKNGKQIGKPELMSKTFGGERLAVVKIPIVENWTDSEYKIELTMEVTSKENLYTVAGSEFIFPRYSTTAVVAGDRNTVATKSYEAKGFASADVDTIGERTTTKGLVDKLVTAYEELDTAKKNEKPKAEAMAAVGSSVVFTDDTATTPLTITTGANGLITKADTAKAWGNTATATGGNVTAGSISAADAITAFDAYRPLAKITYTKSDDVDTAKTDLNAKIALAANQINTEAAAIALQDDLAVFDLSTDNSNTTGAARFDLPKGTKLVVPMNFWAKNFKQESDDVTIAAGTKGIVVKPVKNEENVAEWEDNNDTIARLTFEADSSTAIYFPKLSTKWDNIEYAEKFNDQDAYVREFVSNPSISSTSRAVLELMVPYVNEDDELTIDEADIIVYQQIADGELVDVTSKGTIGYNDADELVFTMKTRELGTYIFAEMPVDEAAADDETAPAEKDTTTGGKVNPGTGA